MPVHKQIRRFHKGCSPGQSETIYSMPQSSNTSASSSDSSSHTTVSVDFSMEGGGQVNRYPVGTVIKKYFNGQGWCLGTVVSISNGQYKVHYESLSESAASRKDFSYSASDIPRLIKTAKVQPGSKLEIYWPQAKRYYRATVKTERPRKRENFLISYDGEKSLAEREWIDLHRHKFRIIEAPPSPVEDRKPAPISSSEHPKEVVLLAHPGERNMRSSPCGPPNVQSDFTELLLGEGKIDPVSEKRSTGVISPSLVPSSVPARKGRKEESPAAKPLPARESRQESLAAKPFSYHKSRYDGVSAPKALPRISEDVALKKTASAVASDEASTETKSPESSSSSPRSVGKSLECSFESSILQQTPPTLPANDSMVQKDAKFARLVSLGSGESKSDEAVDKQGLVALSNQPFSDASRQVTGVGACSKLSAEENTAPTQLSSERLQRGKSKSDEGANELGLVASSNQPFSDSSRQVSAEENTLPTQLLSDCQQQTVDAEPIRKDSSAEFLSEPDDDAAESNNGDGVIIDPVSDPATRAVVSSLITVGSRVSVYWEDDQRFYTGTVTDRRPRGKPFYLEYDDGEEEWIDLRQHKFQLLLDISSPPGEGSGRRRRSTGATFENNSDTRKGATPKGSGKTKLPEPEKTPVTEWKRGVGRPRKDGTPNKSARITDAPATVAVTPKRAVGHPKKDAAPKATDQVKATKADTKRSDTPRRGVGRPKSGKASKNDRKKALDALAEKTRKRKSASESEQDLGSGDESDANRFGTRKYPKKADASNNDISKIGVGSRVAVWWDGDKQYYSGVVERERVHKKPFFLVYDEDKAEEWIDFTKHKFNVLPNAPPEMKKRGRRAKSEGIRPEDIRKIKVGSRVAVWWQSVKQYYDGTVTKKRESDKPFYIEYDRGETGHWIDFSKHTFRLLDSDLTDEPKKKGKKKPQPAEPESSDEEELGDEEEMGDNSEVVRGISVGTRVSVYWEGDSKYYEGVVTRERKNSKMRHYLEYSDGEAAHWIDFKEHWVRVLPDNADAPQLKRRRLDEEKTSKKKKSRTSAQLPKRQKKESPKKRGPGRPKKLASNEDVKVGSRVEIWWSGDSAFYKASVVRTCSQKYRFFVEYDDEEKEWINFDKHKVRVLSHGDQGAQEMPDDEESQADDVGESELEDHYAYDDFVFGAVEKVRIGSRLSVWWPGEKRYFDGTLTKIDDESRKPYFIVYDDDDEEWTDLKRRYFRML